MGETYMPWLLKFCWHTLHEEKNIAFSTSELKIGILCQAFYLPITDLCEKDSTLSPLPKEEASAKALVCFVPSHSHSEFHFQFRGFWWF